MKRNIIFALFALSLVLVSCDRKAEFTHETFVTLDEVTFSVSEIAGEFSIPVTLYNPGNSEIQLIVRTNDGSAEKGTDYDIKSPMSGVLTFAPGETSKEIVVSLNHDPVMTGVKTFEVTIEAADDSFKVGNLNTASCKIRDKEHPLADFIGEWTGDAIDMYNNNAEVFLSVTIAEDETDESYTKLRISNLDPIVSMMDKTYRLKGTVNKEKTKLTIASNQPIGYYSGYESYYTFYCFSLDNMTGGVYLGDTLTLTYDKDDETLVIDNNFGTLFTYTDKQEYIGSLYGSGVVLTKK